MLCFANVVVDCNLYEESFAVANIHEFKILSFFSTLKVFYVVFLQTFRVLNSFSCSKKARRKMRTSVLK